MIKEKTQKIFLNDKKTANIVGVIGILVVLGIIVGSVFLMPWDDQELWAIIVSYALWGFALFFLIVFVSSGIYVYPNGKILCILGHKIKLFSLEEVDEIKITFYEQLNGRYLAYFSVLFSNGRKFVYSYVKGANEWTIRRDGREIFAPSKKQVERVCEQLKNKTKFTVEVKSTTLK